MKSLDLVDGSRAHILVDGSRAHILDAATVDRALVIGTPALVLGQVMAADGR